MTSTRQDAWTQDEDLLLAEVVLRHIREGGTQLGAFEEVGRTLSRTAAACGFRWNSYVRKQYKSGIELAKKQRKELKKQNNGEQPQEKQAEPETTEITLSKSPELQLRDVIRFLEEYEKTEKELQSVVKENQSLNNQISKLQDQVKALKAENNTLENNIQLIEEDYKALIEIMERARKMVVLQEDERSKKVKFQMDRNGNLERVEK
ncbi:RsfA family transcriptional regulator [Bacillus sp. HNG]|uniref:sporulation-specific transcriptional regulator GerR n=1 Tax=Bacillus sp. HNG TaxID=2293325 RepID=UPI000E2E4934|nr:sporulation-specific transcriptional regulator GerR [Bacillus sp. HNG]RFB19167.1 RsfA family transcriptional regulator [Bacillus sp. HNG]